MNVLGDRGSGSSLLVRLGFVDVPGTEEALSQLGVWRDGRPVDDSAAELVTAAADAADPDLAIVALARLLLAARDPDALREQVCGNPGLRSRLLGVLGTSVALGDHLAVHPDDWHALADDEVLRTRPSRYGLEAELLASVGAPADEPLPWGTGGARATLPAPRAVEQLRATYRRCLLTLAARDVVGALAVDDVGGELADLAGATLSAGLAIALTTLPEDAAPCRLAVIGMGKAGGRELNYVSDVDVVFVGEPLEGSDDDEGALRTATKLAAELMRVCALVAWPVDAGLRPEGGAGPLVRTLASHTAYYARWAQTWEFQALLKARPMAGDLTLGEAYTTMVAPLVWSVGERPGFVEDVQAMRRRVESTLKADRADREVKLGRGGLRDIEFAVQLLQLVHGRTDEDVRSGTTLTALAQLSDGGYVGREDGRHLAEAYRWLRTVEHRLQLHRLRRTHLLPAADDADGLRRVARAAGYRKDAVATFNRERAGYGREVRRLHESFYRPLLSAVASLPADQAALTPEAAKVRLEALGFAQPAIALRHLSALTEGMSRRAAIQQTLLPAMLGWFADAADPDAGLLAFRQVSDALGSTPWYLRLLRDEGSAAQRLAQLLASSRLVADLLARAPEAIRLLADDGQLAPRSRSTLESAFIAAVRRREDWEGAVVAARGLRREELLRTACADLLGLVDQEQVGRALSDVASAVLAAALVTAVRKVEAERRQELPLRFAVIAMGRLGGHEQGYSSDADVLFVHDPLPGGSDSDAAAIAHDLAHEMRRLLALPAPDPPLTLDADLRPEGKQGPLSRSLASYAAYYERWSSVWESQALLRAAPVAGDPQLGQEFLDLVAPLRYPQGGVTAEQVREIRRIKARMEVERLPRGIDPKLALKMGPGGLADVEWVVQLTQLQSAYEVPSLRTPSTLPALRAAVEAGLLDPADGEVLETAWSLAARVRNALVLVRGKPAEGLPSSGRDLAGVARVLGYPADTQGDFLDDYRRATRRARAVVERVFYA